MLSRHLRTHLVVAPSTSVGKSIFSTGLVRASLALGERVGYLKPVGTGSGDGDDELYVDLTLYNQRGETGDVTPLL